MNSLMPSTIEPIEQDDVSEIDADDAVYDEIETLLRDDMPRQGCIELAQALEDVMRMLMPADSEFSDPQARAFPMGAMGAAH